MQQEYDWSLCLESRQELKVSTGTMQNQANKISSWPILIQKSSGNPLDRCPGDYWEKKQFISTYQCNTLIRCRRMTNNNLSWPLCQKFSKICYKLNKHSYKVPYDQLAIVFHLIFIHLVASLEKLHWIISFFQETILQPKLFFCLRTAQYPNQKELTCTNLWASS